MRRLGIPSGLAIAAALAGLALAACGGGGVATTRQAGATVSVLMAAAPNSLDPAQGDSAEALEADWLVYTPLLTYDHSNGVPGTGVIPGLAQNPPTVTDGGRIYSLTLQPNLVYSDGQPVKASDFTWAVERAIKLGWRDAPQLITSRIAGAAAFAAGRATTISGISADDAAGEITIRLTAPWGPFSDVLALPVLAPVPRTTPLHGAANRPPIGIGPYEFGSVVAGRSFALVPNPRWQPGQLPGIPRAHVNVLVKITGDAGFNASSVLNNTGDVFDPADRIPPAMLGRVVREAPGRYSKRAVNETDLIFMNVTRAPFSSRLARVAVQTALDENTLKRLGSGTLQEGCYLLPPSMYGHPHDQCPRGNIERGGDVGAAHSLVARSGMAGTRVTVWGPDAPPFAGWMAYYTSLLDQIGFSARLELVPDGSYYATIGKLTLHPQTGFGAFRAGLPSPVDFYQWLTGSAVRAQGNRNWSEIDDPYLNHQVRILGSVPSTYLPAVSSFWHTLDRYLAEQAYLAVFGYETAPVFVSDRLDYSAIHLSPVAGLDWTSLRLK